MTAIAETPADPLWTRARAMFARAVAAIGDAASIARLGSLAPALRRRIVAWLCPLEHIVRKLLLAQAAELRRAEAASAAHGPRTIYVQLPSLGLARHATLQNGSAALLRRTSPEAAEACAAGAARSSLDRSRPETWNARFSFSLPRDPLLVSEACAPRIRDPWADSPPVPPPPPRTPRVLDEADAPLRLARRFEALRRVLENPRPHAERLARLLGRAVRRFPEVVRRCALQAARSNDYDPEDPRLAMDALACAFAAPGAFADTS